MAAVKLYGMTLPDRVMRYLQSSEADTPLPDDPIFAHNTSHIIASAGLSLEAAASHARA